MVRTRASVVRIWILLFVALFAAEHSGAQSSQSNPLQLSFHHATVSVADLDKEIAWYERVLGFQQGKRFDVSDDFAVVQMTMPGYRIDLVWQKGSSRPLQPQGTFRQGWLHIVFKTPAIDAAYKHLLEQKTDVKADRSPQSAITRLVFHDPEGNEVEIVPE